MHINIINKLFLWLYITINMNVNPPDSTILPPPFPSVMTSANSYNFLKFIFYEQNLLTVKYFYQD